ncbi:hypothetical protein BS17DRAFT_749765 [Gyrodon lividus]|nr:hypothetical protein BS17DRAFT_749765 [Gyrodon lividus]
MISKAFFCAITLALSTLTSSAPTLHPRASSTTTGFSQEQNGLDAQKLNAQFATLTANSTCTDGDQACVSGSFSQCVGSTWELQACASGLSCFALPLVAKAGTSLACDTLNDAEARFTAAGVSGGVAGNGTTITNTNNPATTDPESGGDDGDCEDSEPTPMTSATFSMATTPAAASLSGSAALNMNRRQYTGISYGPTFGFSSPTTTSSVPSASPAPSSGVSAGTASPSVSLPPVSAAPSTLPPTVSANATTPVPTSSVPHVTTQSGLLGASPSGSVGSTSTTPTPVATATGSNGIVTVTVLSTVFVTLPANPCTLPTTIGTSALTSSTPAFINTPSAVSTPSIQPSYAPIITVNLNSPAASGIPTPTATIPAVTVTPSFASVSQVTSNAPTLPPSGPAAAAIPTTTTASSPFNFISTN